MVCCWKGMENLQCGSQNHHACHIAWLSVKNECQMSVKNEITIHTFTE